MAVRNLAAIQRQGAMIADAKKNAYEMKKESVFNRIGRIRSCQQEAIDAMDTIKALTENRLSAQFNEWNMQQGARFVFSRFAGFIYSHHI